MNNKNLKNKHNEDELYIITKKALPEVLLNVIKAKDLVENEKIPVLNAAKIVGISRTTYYKYYNEIYSFDTLPKFKTYTLIITTRNKVGNFSKVTKCISKNKFNILTINQSDPIKNLNIATMKLSITNKNCDISELVSELKNLDGVADVKLKK